MGQEVPDGDLNCPTAGHIDRVQPHQTSVIPVFSGSYWVSSAAVVIAAVASGLTLFVPGVLRGPAVMNGSGRGTALVAPFVAVPILSFSIFAVGRGEVRPLIT
jgi:hypothetical protein